MRNIPMQSEISDYTVSLKVLIDLAFKTQFLNNVEPHEHIRFFLLPLFLTLKEPLEKDSGGKVFNLMTVSTAKIIWHLL